MNFILIAFVFVIFSCKTSPEVKPELEPKAEVAKEVPAEKPVVKEEPVKEEVKLEPKVEEKTEKKEVKAPVKAKVEKKKAKDEVVAKFDGVVITKSDKEKAKSEIEILVAKLNKITSKRDYYAWLDYLSLPYKRRYSDPKVLKEVSDGLPGIAKGMKLNSLKDYFSYVFVPSRRNDKVYDISYLSPTRVQVIKKYKGDLLIFYNLEKIKNKWFLVPKK